MTKPTVELMLIWGRTVMLATLTRIDSMSFRCCVVCNSVLLRERETKADTKAMKVSKFSSVICNMKMIQAVVINSPQHLK